VQSSGGVNLDGSLRSAPGIPAALAGNPFESVWAGTASLEGVRLDTGTYNPFEIDISLPAPGHRWLVGRTYNARQDDSGQFNSNGYQGKNWFQVSQPELHLYDDADNAKDVIYLVYGADQVRRVPAQAGSSSNDFKGKNGAAGAFTYASGSPDIWTYTGPNGTTIKFFGGNTASNKADWQLWKITDADGNTSYVGDSSTASTAVTNGFDAGGRITTAYDSANRRYTYTYSTHDSVTRLDTVEAEYLTSGTWTSSPVTATAAQVDYVYYTNESNGDAGDLKTVTITTPTSQSGQDHVKTKYFRYWEGTYDAVTNPGIPHELMLVLDYEGARNFDWSEVGAGEPAFDAGYEAATTANLKPYSLVYLEYDSSNRVNSATFNGSCGCGGGGANGVTLFTYGTNGSYSDGAGYDTTWPRRTVVTRADSTYLTQYFDELGQPLSQVVTNTNPASSPTETWATAVVRDSMGCVTEIDTPASVTAYTHSTGSFTVSSSVGLIRTWTRASSTDVKGFSTDQKYKTGTSGSAYLEHSWTHDYTTATKTLTDVTITRPLIASDRVYSTAQTSGTSGSYLTSYTYTSWGGSYPLSIEKVVTTYPAVSTGTNGSNTADTSSVHLRKDGLTDFAKAEDGEITYTAYTNGQVTTRIQDADTTSLSPPTGFSSTGTRAALSTTMTYDAQGRMRTRTHPTSRREQWTHAKLSDGRTTTLHYPHSTVGGDLYGPARAETRNLAGKVVESGTIAISGGVAPSFSPNNEVDESQADSILGTGVGGADARARRRCSTSRARKHSRSEPSSTRRRVLPTRTRSSTTRQRPRSTTWGA
jgi:YD repeat-containing protein